MERIRIGSSETYSAYQPRYYDTTATHPGNIVEATTLAHTRLPELTYQLDILSLQNIKKPVKGLGLSPVQLEAVHYACQRNEQFIGNSHRAGFFIGDSTGLGKGRIISGIFLENVLQRRFTAVWVTVSTSLFGQCQKDFSEVDDKRLRGIPWFPRSRMPKFKNHTLFVTYSTLASKGFSRIKELIGYLGAAFDGPIIFDECHKGKGVVKTSRKKGRKGTAVTKIGEAVLMLQSSLLKARFVYASATAATIPEELTYMTRLGIWGENTAFRNVDDFIRTMEERGMSSMEALAVTLKVNGAYIARQLCTRNVVHEVLTVQTTPEFRKVYDESVMLFADILHYMRELKVKKSMYGSYWSAHQTFFANLCLSSKIDRAAEYALCKVEEGYSVVFGLQKTGEARFNEILKSGNSLLDFSCASAIIDTLFKTVFNIRKSSSYSVEPMDNVESAGEASSDDDSSGSDAGHDSGAESTGSSSNEDEDSGEGGNYGGDSDVQCGSNYDVDPKLNSPKLSHIKLKRLKTDTTLDPGLANLIHKLEQLKRILPKNPLDYLIQLLGGTQKVAELTGRKCRQVVTNSGNQVDKRKCHQSDRDTNIREMELFQSGLKRFAIISDASSTGISLHAEDKEPKPPQRIHMTLEVAWGADKILQQLGRTHRTGQSSPPIHVFVVSPIPGEQRFISCIQERLSSMNALTQGDRRAALKHGRLSDKIVESSIGKAAVMELFKCLAEILPFPFSHSIDPRQLNDVKLWLSKMDLGKLCFGKFGSFPKSLETTKFMNRILGMPMEIQHVVVLLYYNFTMYKFQEALKEDIFKEGILDLDFPDGADVTIENEMDVPVGAPILRINMVDVDFGISWEGLKGMLKETRVAPTFFAFKGSDNEQMMYVIEENGLKYSISPNDIEECEIRTDVLRSCRQVGFLEASHLWDEQYQNMETMTCIHDYLNGECAIPCCKTGARKRELTVVSGDINSAWTILCKYSKQKDPKIGKVKLSDGTVLVGVILDLGGEDVENLYVDISNEFAKV